jgi:hypothetical protein
VTRLAHSNIPKHRQKFVIKLTHGWLPTRGHPAYTSKETLTETCPRCQAAKETNSHFLTCEVTREKWANEYYQKSTKKECSKIQHALHMAITDVMRNRPVTLPLEYAYIATEQQTIGWNQLLMGRVTTKWADEYDRETGNNNGQQWISRIIKNTWNHIEERWKNRCDLASNENPTSAAINNIEMNKKIEQLYEMRNEVDEVYGKILGRPIEQKLSLPWNQKVDWYNTAVKMVKQGALATRNRIKEGTHVITNFFRSIKTEQTIPEAQNVPEARRTKNRHPSTSTSKRAKGKGKAPEKQRRENFDPP